MADTKDDADADFNLGLSEEFGDKTFDEAPAFAKKELPKGPMIAGGLVAAGAIWMLMGLFKGGPSTAETEITAPAEAGASNKVKPQVINPMAESIGEKSSDANASSEIDIDSLLKPSAPSEATPEAAPSNPEAPKMAPGDTMHEAAREAASQSANHDAQMSAHIDEVQKVLDRIEGQTQMLAQKIQNLETLLRSNSSDNTLLQQKIETVTGNVETLNSSVENVEKNVEKLVNPPKPMNENLELKEAFTNPKWHVHAVIPGRAWLKNTDGETITVIEGDKLDVYGTVLAIDADNSTVTSSSGITFR